MSKVKTGIISAAVVVLALGAGFGTSEVVHMNDNHHEDKAQTTKKQHKEVKKDSSSKKSSSKKESSGSSSSSSATSSSVVAASSSEHEQALSGKAEDDAIWKDFSTDTQEIHDMRMKMFHSSNALDFDVRRMPYEELETYKDDTAAMDYDLATIQSSVFYADRPDFTKTYYNYLKYLNSSDEDRTPEMEQAKDDYLRSIGIDPSDDDDEDSDNSDDDDWDYDDDDWDYDDDEEDY